MLFLENIFHNCDPQFDNRPFVSELRISKNLVFWIAVQIVGTRCRNGSAVDRQALGPLVICGRTCNSWLQKHAGGCKWQVSLCQWNSKQHRLRFYCQKCSNKSCVDNSCLYLNLLFHFRSMNLSRHSKGDISMTLLILNTSEACKATILTTVHSIIKQV